MNKIVTYDDVCSRLPQQLFITEIVNETEFLNVCTNFEIAPQNRFEATVEGKERSYAVFCLKHEIDDLRMCYAVQGCLRKLFGARKDIRTFHKELVSEFLLFNCLTEKLPSCVIDDTKTLDVEYLLDVACFKTFKDDPNKNGTKAVKTFLEAINIQYDGTKSRIEIEKRPFEKVTNSSDALLYNIDTGYEIVKVYLAVNNDDFIKLINNENEDVVYINNVKVKGKKKRDSSDIDLLIANSDGCKLLQHLFDDKARITLEELRGLAKVLCGLGSAQKKVIEWMERSNQYEELQMDLIKFLFKCYRNRGYETLSSSCKQFCSVYNECSEDKLFKVNKVTDLLKQKKNTIRRMKSFKTASRSKESIREEMRHKFQDDLSSEDNCIYAYKCFPGIGKTHMYLDELSKLIEEQKTVIIAFPSHQLKEDVKNRLHEHLDSILIDSNVITVQKLPDISDTFKDEIDSFYAIGDFNGARKHIRTFVETINAKESSEVSDVERELLEYDSIISKLYDKESTTGKIILTTHDRLLSLRNIEPDIVIIDEDITNTVLKQMTVKKDELHTLRLRLQNLGSNNSSDDINKIIKGINSILSSEKDKIYVGAPILQNNERIKKAVLQIISENKGTLFNSRIIDLLFNSSAFVLGSPHNYNEENSEEYKQTISFIVRRELPFTCKTFILSATIDFEIYQRVFAKHEVVQRPFETPKLAAHIIMKHDYAFSRRWFRDNIKSLDEHIQYRKVFRDYYLSDVTGELEERTSPVQPLVITFKEFEKDFQERGFDISLHFGNTVGLDQHRGRHIIVFGTPNKNAVLYSLYVSVVYPEERLERIPDLIEQLVTNESYRFYFLTAPDSEKFRKIHMLIVESELIQALGRARPLDNPCLIYLYTNYPPSGIDMVLLNNK